MKKAFATLLATMLVFGLIPSQVLAANNLRDVVINEVAWGGSADNANDEWIELYNNTATAIDLSGWKIIDDITTEYALSGLIPAHGYYLIEDAESVTSVQSNAIANLSLANSGDSLTLVDNSGFTVDVVNSSGGAWLAGSTTTFTTMERVNPQTNGDTTTNWLANLAPSGATASLGSPIKGTPKTVNSVTTLPATVTLNLSDLSPNQGESVTLSVQAANITDLFSYGFEIAYNPAVLTFVSANKKAFLGSNGTVNTSFQSALENNSQGKLLAAEARLLNPAVGVSGNGDLFEVTFMVTGEPGSSSNISILPSSFLANSINDMIVNFSNANLAVELSVIDPVENFNVSEGSARYSLNLSWQAPTTGADSYKVFKKDQFGNFVLIKSVNTLSDLDSDDLVPTINYDYQIVAIKNGIESTPVTASGKDNRGLVGDNDRSDRVDGRDLQRLANKFALNLSSSGFDKKIDTNYDALIDGIDLLDITANFGLTY